MTVSTSPLSNSAFVQRCMQQAINDAVANGSPIASMYVPLIETIVLSVLSQMAADAMLATTATPIAFVASPTQVIIAAEVAKAKKDPK